MRGLAAPARPNRANVSSPGLRVKHRRAFPLPSNAALVRTVPPGPGPPPCGAGPVSGLDVVPGDEVDGIGAEHSGVALGVLSGRLVVNGV